ncbi:MAG TPA: MBL fold metallo-hydrolase [Halothiobacillus sp.]|nr:MBL fold metallo-hydrolase [Halothiobacillus sp.]
MNKLEVQIIPVTPFQQNCALIWNTDTLKGAVIDPGGDVHKIAKAVKAAGVTVETIFLTHGHLDHAAGATDLAHLLGVPIVGPQLGDKFLLDSLPEQAIRFGVHGLTVVKPDQWLNEGETISIGGESFEVLHCPGHTPGHVVFVNKPLKFGIFGDVLFRNSVGRTDFAYGNHDDLISAITTKLMVLPDDFAFICGHGESSTIGAERRSNPFIR